MNQAGKICFALIAGVTATQASAVCEDSNYGMRLSLMNATAVASNTACTKTAEQFIDLFYGQQLKNLLNGYTDQSISSFDVNFNSLKMRMDFFTQGSPLRLQIADLGVDETFNGQTRDDSISLLKDYFKKNGIAGRIMRYQVSNSATSPIAGPNGIIQMAARQDFDTGFSGPVQGSSSADSGNLIGAGFDAGSGQVGGKKSSAYSLPLSYVWRSKQDPGRTFTLGASLVQVKTEGATGYHAGLGVSARIPMSENWALFPVARYTITNSVELNTAAGVYSVSLGSTYRIPIGESAIMIGNMLGYYKTASISVGSYSFNPDVSTMALRNGVLYSHPVALAGRPLAVEYSLVDTRFTGGTKFFVNNTQEIAVSLGSNRAADAAGKFFRVGLRYLRGRETHGLSLQGSYWF